MYFKTAAETALNLYLGVECKTGQVRTHTCWVIHDDCRWLRIVPDRLRRAEARQWRIGFRHITMKCNSHFIQNTVARGMRYWSEFVEKSVWWSLKFSAKLFLKPNQKKNEESCCVDASPVTWEWWKAEWEGSSDKEGSVVSCSSRNRTYFIMSFMVMLSCFQQCSQLSGRLLTLIHRTCCEQFHVGTTSFYLNDDRPCTDCHVKSGISMYVRIYILSNIHVFIVYKYKIY